MSGNTFGEILKITTFGESHGKALGVVIDGFVPGMEISVEEIEMELARRRPGQSDLVTPRKENDRVEILSGVFEGKTTGTPIALIIFNEDQKSGDYENIKDKFRPSHADYTYKMKYGLRDYRGGGRSSARETVARVAAGALAQKFLKHIGVNIFSYVQQVGNIQCLINDESLSRKLIDANNVRCPDEKVAAEMESLIKVLRAEGDTVGGVVRCVVTGMPVGLGEPVFDKLHAQLGKAMLSINAVKGFEIGAGFSGVEMKGSEHNDEFYMKDGKVKTKTNYSGGVQGGISNGENLYFRVAFKPVATLMREQNTVDENFTDTKIRAFGRHDACVLPRAVPIVDAMTALVLMDFYLRDKIYHSA